MRSDEFMDQKSYNSEEQGGAENSVHVVYNLFIDWGLRTVFSNLERSRRPFAAPAEGTLKDFMEFAETGFADHEQSPPNQRTHATEHYAELINRNRRYGRFRHASSLPKPTRTPSNLTPRNLPLSRFETG